MDVVWCLHKLAKDAEWIAEVGRSNGEIDKVAGKLTIESQLTLFYYRIDI